MPPTSALLWIVRLSWLALPFVAGPAWAAALDARSTPVQLTASVLLWSGWAASLVATLVPRPLGLTVHRVVAPASLAAALLAVALGDDAVGAVAGGAALAATGLAVVVAMLPETGGAFVQGGAYGDERRHLLRAPGPVLAGPVVVAEAALVAGVVTGPLLLAARTWVVGAVATVAGWVLAAVLFRALHALAERWVVFVPAGMVLKDHLALVDPVLFRRGPRPGRPPPPAAPAGMVLKDHLALVDPVLFRRVDVEVLRPAPADTDAIDLTARSPGLALELRLREKVPLLRTPAERGGKPAPGRASRLLFTPSRPGAVLAEARRRRLPVA